jgi:predicted thioesterase
MAELFTGIKGKATDYVSEEVTAQAMASGGLPVYATPRMVAMMEYTAWSSTEPFMDEDLSTVGTHLDINHLAASPVGSRITYESELTEISGRKLVFHVTASDETGLIGEGTHER